MTAEKRLANEIQYADKLMSVLTRITPKNYEDVVRIRHLILDHQERRTPKGENQ